jgi:hypothetical protein
MSYKNSEITYFTEEGSNNTDITLLKAKKRAEQLSIKNIVVASTRGETGVKSSDIFEGYNLIVVTHHTGYKGPDIQELTNENRKYIINKGGKILTSTHTFGGIGRAVRKRFNTYQVDEIIAATLKTFGQGTKVVVEIVLAAADTGLISTKEDVISIGGSGRGADTAVVITPTNVIDFFNIKIREIICKPIM